MDLAYETLGDSYSIVRRHHQLLPLEYRALYLSLNKFGTHVDLSNACLARVGHGWDGDHCLEH
jgi:hypothetical protein